MSYQVATEGDSVAVEDWTSQQQIDCEDSCCCGKERARNRKGREMLFREIAVEELEDRYEQYVSSLMPAEEEAIQKVIRMFRNGKYRRISVKQRIGTFYFPVSPILTMCLRAHAPWLLFPLTQKFFFRPLIQSCISAKYPEFLDCLGHIAMVVLGGVLLTLFVDLIVMLFCYPIVIVVEFALCLLSFLFFYGFHFLQKNGAFTYSFVVHLIIAQVETTETEIQGTTLSYAAATSRTRKKTIQDIPARVEIPNAPVKRICSQPVAMILKGMDMETYTFGDFAGRQIRESDKERYKYLCEQQKSARLKAIEKMVTYKTTISSTATVTT